MNKFIVGDKVKITPERCRYGWVDNMTIQFRQSGWIGTVRSAYDGHYGVDAGPHRSHWTFGEEDLEPVGFGVNDLKNFKKKAAR